MNTVESPMISSVHTKVRLRPMMSPKWPNRIDPTGRAKNATPNVANDARVPIAGLTSGKNTVGNTSAAAVP